MMGTSIKLNQLVDSLSTIPWKLPRCILLAHCLLAIIELRTVNLSKWAVHFDHNAEVASNYKRLQRFLRDDSWAISALRALWINWLPQEDWVLCLDRTNWMLGKTPINLLVLGVAYKGIAIPLFWTALSKQGNSNQSERIKLIQAFIEEFGTQRVKYLTADREFRGTTWLKWLTLMDVKYRIRVPNNTLADNRFRNRKIPVSRLFPIRIGEVMTLNRSREIWGNTVWLLVLSLSKYPQLEASLESMSLLSLMKRQLLFSLIIASVGQSRRFSVP